MSTVFHSFGCKQQSTQVCLACGTEVCACHGLARGQCPVCYVGFLSNYYKPKLCGYKGCKGHAVATVPRVGKACLEHAKSRAKFAVDPRRVEEYAQIGIRTPYTSTLLDRLLPEFIAKAAQS